MKLFNEAATSLFSFLLSPFSKLEPVWGLLAVSAIAGILLAFAYGKISNQKALKAVKRKITAGMFESVLFRHDLRSSLAAQSRMFIGGVTYFALAIPPILILAIPSLIILAQLNLRYGARALNPGERAMLTVEVANEDLLFEAHAKASGDISITPPIRDLDNLQVSWRVDPKPAATDSNSQQAKVILSIGEASTEQPIHVGTRPETLPTEVHVSPLWQFLYPGGTVPQGLSRSVKSIGVTYPEDKLGFAGLRAHWLVLFLCVSLLTGFVASKALGVEI